MYGGISMAPMGFAVTVSFSSGRTPSETRYGSSPPITHLERWCDAGRQCIPLSAFQQDPADAAARDARGADAALPPSEPGLRSHRAAMARDPRARRGPVARDPCAERALQHPCGQPVANPAE